MRFATRVVPMPHWSTPLGCTKLFLTIVVLAFTAACTAVWGWYPAFSTTIFSATLSLLTFGYYLTALSFRPKLYNKWLVLSLETILTLLWFVSLILLAGWTGASTGIPRFYYTLSPYPAPYGTPSSGTSIDLSGRSLDRGDLLSHSWEPFRMWRRQETDVPRTLVRVHGMDAHYTAQILAGISSGLAGMIFIMYAVTLATFILNFHSITSESRDRSSTSAVTNDEEMQVRTEASPHHVNTSTNQNESSTLPITTSTTISSSMTPPPFTTPLRISSLPKDFEPRPQEQEFYLSPEQATEAGIEPPTPVLRALRVERESAKEVEKEGTSEREMSEGKKPERESVTEAVVGSSEDAKRGYTVKDDGRLEREV